MNETIYKHFFDHYERYKNIQTKQKLRGLNDFNLLLTVLKYDDEVRLHSRMIGELLSPVGKHYQHTLFLESFLHAIGLENWGLNYDQTAVYTEYKDIDIYITDGSKHLIIENKIWAEDQPCQVMKYINIIVEENKENIVLEPIEEEECIKLGDEIYVLYMTPRAKKMPSEHKVDEEGYIYFSGTMNTQEELKKCSKRSSTKSYVPNGLKNYKAKYKKVSYKKVLKWLETSQFEVKNITNLNESLQQYIDTVKKVTKTYKGNVMDFASYVKKNNLDLETIFQVKQEIENFQSELLYNFFLNAVEGLPNVNNEIKKSHKSLVFTKKSCEAWFQNKKEKDFGTFYKLDDTKLLFVGLGTSYIHYGIVRHENYKLIDAKKSDESYGLTYRKWNKIKWFSYGCFLIENLNILSDYENSEFKQGLYELIAKFVSK